MIHRVTLPVVIQIVVTPLDTRAQSIFFCIVGG
jgi:hypothetical protein